MNLSPKQTEVRQVIYENNLSVCAILESHVANRNLERLCKHVFKHWSWISNAMSCLKGTRIIVGWNQNDVDVAVIHQDPQVIHTRIWIKADRKEFFCSFVYAFNNYIHRRPLWNGLCLHKNYINNRPWCLLGDFNASLFVEDTSMGSSALDITMREFKECVETMEVMDVQRTGLQFTWNQKPKGKDGMLRKLDRVLANLEFLDSFVGAHAVFKPYRISDHSPSVLSIPSRVKEKPKPFKFFNVVLLDDRFKDMVRNGWLAQVSGFYMFRVVKKLKGLKKPIRKLMYDKGNLHANVVRLREELDKVQTDLDNDPSNLSLREKEAATVVAFNEALLMEEKFLKQKAKITWLREGDSNTAYFHKVVKSRVSRSRIDVVTDANGAVYHNNDVAKAFINHYEVFLGQPGNTSDFNTDNLFPTRLNDSEALNMVRDISSQEVKSAMFSMGNDKSPGPDGFTAGFFKDTWDIIGADVIKAVSEFFTNGRLLKELNHTIIALIPKVNTPARVNDYRPISCCNVLFKCISKIIANRLKDSLQRLVSPNQSAFVPGRCISDNILLTQEIMHNYHLDRGVPRCAFKVDIQKAYDTVDWNFLRVILIGFGFHERMIAWIMECVTTTSFSISINGSLHGYFKGKRGLRQGDPLSPYLFTLIMEVFTLILHRRVQEASNFTYHRFCSELDLINLCFADDLFLFVHGDVNSAKVIKEALDDFKDASGLNPSMPKSKAYFCNVINYTKLAILNVLPFEEDRLPVKYLGVPLVSSRLIFRDCKELIDKVQNRVNDWKAKSLSIAGRLQLIQSVLGSLHVYWASVFMLPTRVLLDIEQIMRGFLWCHGSMCRGKAKVAWDVVCLPKQEGGLGVRRLDHFNKALMVSHVWKLLSLKESLWVKWIHVYKLNNRSFWDIPYRGTMSWSWRKLLLLRPLIREFIWSCIGDGKKTSIWFDKWCVANGLWKWPNDWLVKYPLLNSIPVPTIFDDNPDSLEWRSRDGIGKPFSVHNVWDSIRPRDNLVSWYDFVWFRACIPRHAFNMWLIFKQRLRTQDCLRSWEVVAGLAVVSRCVSRVYQQVCCLPGAGPSFASIVTHLMPIAKRKSSKSCIGKLVVAAAAYFVWQERNARLFNKVKRSVTDVVDSIISVVRLKLLSCHFKKSKEAILFARLWEIPMSNLK
ncbi:putative RNA-directed DNA polymerase [Tanacetum coccineum]